MRDTFITETQARVLEFRAKGLTKAEIARRLRTSRANVCILERRGRENVARAERTLKLAAKLRAPVVLEVKQGDDIFEVPRRLLKAADAAKIKVRMGTPISWQKSVRRPVTNSMAVRRQKVLMWC